MQLRVPAPDERPTLVLARKDRLWGTELLEQEEDPEFEWDEPLAAEMVALRSMAWTLLSSGPSLTIVRR